MYDWIVIALRLSTTQLNSTRLAGSGAGLFREPIISLYKVRYSEIWEINIVGKPVP